MPRQFGKVDLSTGWACSRCPHKHAPLAVCPPSGMSLMLLFCHRCNPKTGAYCSRHGGHRMPEPPAEDAHHTLPDIPEQAEHLRRYDPDVGLLND